MKNGVANQQVAAYDSFAILRPDCYEVPKSPAYTLTAALWLDDGRDHETAMHPPKQGVVRNPGDTANLH